MSKRLEDLKPEVAEAAQAFLMAASTGGHRLMIIHTLRTLEEQGYLYAKGRSIYGEPCHHSDGIRPVGACVRHPRGAPVTNARPGYSWHNFGRAIDVAFIVDGKPSWAPSHPWTDIGALGEAMGFKWGGGWGDLGHFEMSGGRTLEQCRAALGISDAEE